MKKGALKALIKKNDFYEDKLVSLSQNNIIL
jgi:hypothetical protein